MKRLTRLVIVAALLSGLAAAFHLALAAPSGILAVTSFKCDSSGQSFAFSETALISGKYDVDVSFNGDTADAAEGFGVPVTAGGTYSFHGSDKQIQNGTIARVIVDESTVLATTTCTPSPVTFCDLSADGRLNSRCGDRIVVYCNGSQSPPNLDIWVVDSHSEGHELAKLPLATLSALKMGQFTKNMGRGGMIFAGLNAQGDGYAAVRGGPFHATAKGDWAKTFSCKAHS